MTDTRDLILEGLADGKSLRAICAQEGMPALSTVMRWLQADEAWREQYAHARAAGDDAMAEDIQEISDTEPDAQRARVRIDARKWLLAKRQPKKYGDKLAVGGADDLPAIKSEGANLNDLVTALCAATGADTEQALRQVAGTKVQETLR